MWEGLFSRAELRALAKKHGIERGRNKRDTALNLKRGYGRSDSVITRFPVTVYLD